jgi:DNA modification methylase
MSAEVVHGDCRGELTGLPADSFDSVVTDPPYELGFMGRAWDKSGVAFDPDTWRAVLRVLKPGGYMLAMGGTRTYHRLTCAIEDAGFEIRDCLMWPRFAANVWRRCWTRDSSRMCERFRLTWALCSDNPEGVCTGAHAGDGTGSGKTAALSTVGIGCVIRGRGAGSSRWCSR